MTSVGCLAVAGRPELHAATIGSPAARLLAVSAGDVVGSIASLIVLALLWWPFVVAAVAGAWLVFAKAGRPGWACLVPGYNGVEFLRVAKLPAWLWVLFFVPCVNLALFAVACVRVARAFRKGPRFAAGLVLLPPVYMAILGLGPSRYRHLDLVPSAEAEGEGQPPGRTAPSDSGGPAVKLVALPGFGATGGGCGPGESRLAAAGVCGGRSPGQLDAPRGPPRPRLHLV